MESKIEWLGSAPPGHTISTKTVLSSEQTRTNIPAPSTAVTASFFAILRLVPQSIGSGTARRYKSVITLETNVTQTIGLATAP